MYFLREFEKTLMDALKRHSNLIIVNTRIHRFLSYIPLEYGEERDPAPIFFHEEIQGILKSLTRVDLSRVFKKKKLGDTKLELPVYKFMTDEQLQESLELSKKRAQEVLQMPPVVQVRKPIDRVYVEDRALIGHNTNRMIFTDITFGVKDRNRLIVVRELDGMLRDANWKERDRMNQIYFPKNKQKLKVPKMFEDKYLQDLLGRKEYEFILNCACAQFEPDNEQYQKVTSLTYQHINDNNGFECLRSTRHFGPLIFYLSWFKNIDNLLLELIETAHIVDANRLLQLYKKIHETDLNITDVQSLDGIMDYVKQAAVNKSSLELAVQAYIELVKQRKQLDEGIHVAHGLM
ncbi:hypothetical protein FQA39_LY15593 [Lamprigera yunnana]|nr:hypothetical protein FQA39_LY15593 [Lamprigera yunnana]